MNHLETSHLTPDLWTDCPSADVSPFLGRGTASGETSEEPPEAFGVAPGTLRCMDDFESARLRRLRGLSPASYDDNVVRRSPAADPEESEESEEREERARPCSGRDDRRGVVHRDPAKVVRCQTTRGSATRAQRPFCWVYRVSGPVHAPRSCRTAELRHPSRRRSFRVQEIDSDVRAHVARTSSGAPRSAREKGRRASPPADVETGTCFSRWRGPTPRRSTLLPRPPRPQARGTAT